MAAVVADERVGRGNGNDERMTSFNIEVEGFDQISSKLGRSRVLVLGSLNRSLRRIGGHFVPALKSRTPVRTGKLRASTRFQVKGSAEDMRLEVRQGARSKQGVIYRPFVVGGTRPHEIRPVNKKALRFNIGGRVVFAKKVNHPGTKPNPYTQETIAAEMPQVKRIVQEEADRLAERLLA